MVETTVVVLTWNQKDLTIRCLHSLLKQEYADYEVILVDNGSDDGTPEAITKEFGDKVRVIALSENRGFCGGNNEGVRNSSKESKYVMFLNNDTIVPDNLLSEMIKSIKSDQNIGAVSVPVFNKGIEHEMQKIIDGNVSGTCNFFGDVMNFVMDKSAGNNYPILVPCGCCFVYQKSLVDFPFDDDYFIYAEENYFGMLLRTMGKEVLTCKNTSIFHENSAVKKKSSKSLKNHFNYLGRRNKLLNQLLFFETKTLIKLFPLMFIYHLFESIGDFKNLPQRVHGYLYVLVNINKIREKRTKIKESRLVSDVKFLQNFSGKMYDEHAFSGITNRIVCILNWLFLGYCKLFHLKTIEQSLEAKKSYAFLHWRGEQNEK